MALTVNSVPANIDNSAAFNVTTDLVEDATHVNLRVRADIYHEGIIKATVEKPKGLADFDFKSILISFIPGDLYARGGADKLMAGNYGSNLITSWSDKYSNLDTFSGGSPLVASKSTVANAAAESNDIAVTIGDIFMINFVYLSSTGANPPYIIDGDLLDNPISLVGNTDKSIILMATSTGNKKILIGNTWGEFDFSVYVEVLKITTNRTTIGGMLAPYKVSFTEVYEDVAGVTTTGAIKTTNVYRYVNSRESSFMGYALTSSSSLWANKTLKNNITKYYIYDNHISGYSSHYEYRLGFFTEYSYLDLYASVDGGSYYKVATYYIPEGWGMVIVGYNAITFITSIKYKLCLHYAGTQISQEITIYANKSEVDERVILEYDGSTGGKEYLSFEGLKDQTFSTIRNYCLGSKKNRKPLGFYGICQQTLETLFKDSPNTEYLKDLLISNNVKRLELSNATPTDVTVITPDVTINKGRELFTNQIQIEYEY